MVSIRFVDSQSRKRHTKTIRRLLVAADDSFVPPLTGPERTSVARSADEGGQTDIDGYVDRCLSRPMVGAFDDGDLVGFSSFHEMTSSPPLEDYTPTNHVSILIVDERYRNRGIATQCYEYLIDEVPESLEQPSISTKTWHTNHAHIAVLEALSFSRVEQIPDDRGPGIDTVYYARQT